MAAKKTKVSINEEAKKKTTATKTTAKKSAKKVVEEIKTEEVASKPVEEVKETPIEKKEVAISVVEKKVSDLNFAYHDPLKLLHFLILWHLTFFQ